MQQYVTVRIDRNREKGIDIRPLLKDDRHIYSVRRFHSCTHMIPKFVCELLRFDAAGERRRAVDYLHWRKLYEAGKTGFFADREAETHTKGRLDGVVNLLVD